MKCSFELHSLFLEPKTAYLEAFFQEIKNRVSSRLLVKIRVSQVFWEPIKNSLSPRSALLEAVYVEALLYSVLLKRYKIE
jgi:hypothetical protein